MTATAQQLCPNLLVLPEADRAELAHLLLESLEPPASDDEEQAFDAELARRAEEIHSGKVAGISAHELFTRLDAKSTSLKQ